MSSFWAHWVCLPIELNDALSDYGPENCRGFPRVTVKVHMK